MPPVGPNHRKQLYAMNNHNEQYQGEKYEVETQFGIDSERSSELVPFEDPFADDALSDGALDSVAGGFKIPADVPGKLREAADCYRADADSEETFSFMM